MRTAVRWATIAGALLLSGCALSPLMPPMSRADAVVAPVPLARRAPPARHTAPVAPIVSSYDSSLTLTRWSVTTHPGLFFLWIRRPRLTFYFDTPGRDVGASPATVEFVYRTQSPMDIVDNRLAFDCAGERRAEPVTPVFSEDLSANTVTQYLLYRLPLADFAAIADCASLTAVVGTAQVEFSDAQRAALRELAQRMVPASAP